MELQWLGAVGGALVGGGFGAAAVSVWDKINDVKANVESVKATVKEASDERTEGNHFCWKDIVADVVGIALGTAVHIGLRWLLIC